jgi:streptogramin lyase
MGFPSAATISNGANGARILGQPDYNAGSTMAGISSSAISGPTGLFIDAAGNLWVLDEGNNRVLRFANIKSIDNGKPASSVVGQADFTGSLAGLDARRLDTADANNAPGIFVPPDGSLWISDLNNHRVLRYATADSEPPSLSIKGKHKATTTKARFVVRGTASDDTGVRSVTIQVGRKQKPAVGTTVWKKPVKLVPGRNVVKAFAIDTTGKTSPIAKVILIRKAAP